MSTPCLPLVSSSLPPSSELVPFFISFPSYVMEPLRRYAGRDISRTVTFTFHLDSALESLGCDGDDGVRGW